MTSPDGWLPMLQAGASVMPNGGPNDGVVADFNGDGLMDVAVATSSPQNVYVYFAIPGDGGYSAPFIYEAGAWPLRLTAGDMNHDGIADLVVGNSGTLAILLSHADGGFGDPLVTQVGGWVGPLTVADVNHDGWNDVLAYTGGTSLFTNLGQGDGQVSSAHFIESAGQNEIGVGDFAHTGFPDLVTSAGDLTLVLNDGGTFLSPVYNPPGNANAFAIGRFLESGLQIAVAESGNNRLDLVSVDSTTGSAIILSSSRIDTGGSQALAIDLNGDGFDDVVTFGGSAIGVSINLSDGGFADAVDFTVPGTSAPTAYGIQAISGGDVNGDGVPDVVVFIGGNNASAPFVQMLSNFP